MRRSFATICAQSKRPVCPKPQTCSKRFTSSPSSIHSLLHSQNESLENSSQTVQGFIRSVRKQKNIAFAAVSDGSGLEALQVVLTPQQAQDLSTGCAVSVTGELKKSPPGAKQSHELVAEKVSLIGHHEPEVGASDVKAAVAKYDQTYPLQKKYHSPDFLRTIPHLRVRSPFNSLLLRLRSQVLGTVTSFFEESDYIQTHPPIISSSDCEGAGEVFSVETLPELQPGNESQLFFRTPKYLTVSSQLHLEALAQSVGKVWTISPTFRAEKSNTPRHLSEFYMLEVELNFTKDLSSVMDVAEQMLQSVAARLLQSRLGQEILSAQESRVHSLATNGLSRETIQSRWLRLQAGNWPRISYSDAVSVLQATVADGTTSFEFVPQLGASLQAEHERYLAEKVGQGGPVFVTDYPRDIKAFYMARSPDSKTELETVACFDLLVPDLCEIAGGSLREYRLDHLLESMDRHGLLQKEITNEPAMTETAQRASRVPENLRWYVDLRRYGSVPHGGFGLGFDRLLCYLSGVSSVRDLVAFPRYFGRCDC